MGSLKLSVKGLTRTEMINHHNITEEQRQVIMREVLEEHISPNELARKYSIPAYAIRDWIKNTGNPLPKSYIRTLKSGNNAQLPGSNVSSTSYQKTTPKRIPGKLALCKQ